MANPVDIPGSPPSYTFPGDGNIEELKPEPDYERDGLPEGYNLPERPPSDPLGLKAEGNEGWATVIDNGIPSPPTSNDGPFIGPTQADPFVYSREEQVEASLEAAWYFNANSPD